MQTFAQSEQTFNLVTSVDALNTTDKYLVAPAAGDGRGKVQYGLWAMGEAKENGKGFTGVEITPDITELPGNVHHIDCAHDGNALRKVRVRMPEHTR